MNIDLTGRVALVTGAAQGIGAAIAAALKDAGATIHLSDIDAKGLAVTGEALAAPTHQADLSSREAAHALVEAVSAASGGPHILALAAGGVRGQVGRPLEEIDAEAWHALFQANVDGAMWVSQAAAPTMKRGGWGRIITIASGAGLRPSLTGIQGYAAAKHALIGLTRQLSWELGPHGITVNSVAPGFVRSNPTTERQWASYGADGQKRLVETIHARRTGAPQDIASPVVFLASDHAAWISGQVLSVDGGRS